MINLTRPLPSRRTTKGRVKERERERGKLCRAIISSCVDYCLAGDEVEKCTACTATATSQFVLGFVHWMKLITNQGRRILFFFSSSLREARTRADEIRSPFSSFLSLFFFSFTPPVSFGKDVEQYASQAPSVSSRVRLHSSSSAPPISIRFSRSTKDKHPTHPQSYLVFATRNGDSASGRNT